MIRQQKIIIDDLENALLEEQGYICCYCGARVKKETVIKEHFLDKKNNERYTFDYTNLLASCEGGKIAYYSFNQKVTLENGQIVNVKTFDDVLTILSEQGYDLSVEILKQHSKNKSINKKTKYESGDKFYFPNPPHCDTAKGHKRDAIINPSKVADCEFLFIYKASIEKGIICEGKNDLAQKTIGILELNTDNLANNIHRISAYDEAIKTMDELLGQLEIDDIRNDIHNIIQTSFYTKENDKLIPFCGVTASVLYNLIK